MYSVPIYFNALTYQVRQYGKRKSEIVLIDKVSVKTSREICLGNTLDMLNDPELNEYLIGRLKTSSGKSLGCEVKITNVEPISQCGYTTKRFKTKHDAKS